MAFQENEIIMDAGRINEILQRGGQEEAFLEVTLDRSQEGYTSKFAVSSEEGDSGEFLYIRPLEPAAGNMKIRSSNQVVAGFSQDVYLLKFNSQFVGVVVSDGRRLIKLNRPRVVQVLTRRRELRLRIPPEIQMKVHVKHQGRAAFWSEVLDITKGGMGCECETLELATTLKEGDRLNLELHCRALRRDPLPLAGVVCFRTRVRSDGADEQPKERFGIQFVTVAVSHSMQLDRLVDTVRRMVGNGDS